MNTPKGDKKFTFDGKDPANDQNSDQSENEDVPAIKTLVQKDNDDNEIFVSDMPDVDFDKQNEEQQSEIDEILKTETTQALKDEEEQSGGIVTI